MKKKILNTLCLGLVGVTTVAFAASCGDKTDDSGNTTNATYTYNATYSGDFSSGGWDPLTWQLSNDDVPLSYTSCGLYAFNLNSTKDGYNIDPELAAAMPVDVSSQYGYDANSGYAYKVQLREDAYFDNGVQITAQTFVDSYKLLIDSAYNNYRATTYEADGLVIKNSTLYHYQGQTALTAVSDVVSMDSLAENKGVDNDANVKTKAYYSGLENSFGADKATIQADFPEFKDEAFSVDGYINLGSTYDTAYANYVKLATKYVGSDYASKFEGWFPDEAFVYYTYPERTEEWFESADGVGVKATGTYELTLVLGSPLNTFNFEYNLSSTWLVEPEAYKSMTTTASDGTKSSTYNKTAATSVSYGPYKMSTYTTTEYTLEKNKNWFGYTDGNHEGQYQTTNINYHKVENANTILMGFKQGNYDEVSLSSDLVSDYSESSQLVSAPESYLMSYFMNSNIDYLKQLDSEKTTTGAVLFAYDDFRKGLSYSINRTEAAQAAPGSDGSALLLNTLYMADAENGVVYRNTDSGKSVYSNLYGAGSKGVADSYSIDKAVECFNKAYAQAIKDGNWHEGDKTIKINIGIKDETDESSKAVSNLQKFLQAALRQSKFGSDITVTVDQQVTSAARYSNLKSGKTVCMFGAWGGNIFDPYGFIQVYFSDSYNYMPGFKPSSETVTVSIDGTNVTKTYSAWHKAITSGEYSDASGFAKLEKDDKSSSKTASQVYILSQLETAYLQQLELIPVYALGSKSLRSYKVEYGTDEYITGIGYGGIQYMTYNYTDAEWEEVKSNITY